MYGDMRKLIVKAWTTGTILALVIIVAACSASSTVPTPSEGATIWAQKPCHSCHGEKAQGGAGPKLAGTSLNFDQFKKQVRTPRGVMPASSASQVSDNDLQSIYSWLQSLK